MDSQVKLLKFGTDALNLNISTKDGWLVSRLLHVCQRWSPAILAAGSLFTTSHSVCYHTDQQWLQQLDDAASETLHLELWAPLETQTWQNQNAMQPQPVDIRDFTYPFAYFSML